MPEIYQQYRKKEDIRFQIDKFVKREREKKKILLYYYKQIQKQLFSMLVKKTELVFFLYFFTRFITGRLFNL